MSPDLRLGLPALAAWVVAWQARLLDPLLVGVLAAVLVVAAVVLLQLQRFLAAAVLVCAAGAGAVTALHVHARTTGPLSSLAASQAAVTVDAVLLDDPRVVPPRGDQLSFRTLVVARVRVERVTAAGEAIRLRQQVLVLSSDTTLLGRLPSQHLRLEGRLQAPQTGDDVAALLSERGPPVLLGRPTAVQRVAGALRQGLRDAVATLPSDQRGLLPGLVDGDTSALDPRLNDDFRTTGLTHLTAVSGSNVGVVLSAALLVCGWVGLGLRWRAPVAGLALLGFVVLARPQPSVLRAAVMGAIALLALQTGGRRQAVPALSATVLVLVLLQPDLAASPGFALSTLATAALLLLAPVWKVRLQRWLPGWAAEALAVPAAAQVACTPVVVALSGSLGLLAVPANLLAVPAVAPATVLGVLAALVAPVWMPVAHGLAWLAWLPTWWLTTLAHVGAAQPGASARLPTGGTGAVLSLLLLAGVGLVLRSRTLRRLAVASTAGVLLAVLVLVVARPAWPPKGWLMVSCDVGQGDSFVVRLPDDSALLIDSGPDPKPVDQCLRRLGVDRVALLVLTHLHADHVEGVPGVLRGRHVGQVEIGPLDEPAVERERLLRWLGAKNVPVVRAQIGEVRTAGAVSWEVLDATARRGTDSDPNNSSIVLRLVTHGVSVLFSGDLEGEAQRSLQDRGVDLQADVLKVPHHGSAKQDPAFLDAVGARVALTPVGAGNPYGHPAASTLARLERDGARVYRSDRDGDVAIVLGPTGVEAVGRGGDGVAPVTVATHHAEPLAVTAVRATPVLPVPVDLCDAVARAPPRSPPWQHGPVPDAPATLTLVVGEEELLVARAVSRVLADARQRNPDTEVLDVDGLTLEPAVLLDALSPSLFGDEKVMVVRGAQDLSKEAVAALSAYVADPLPEISLIVVHAGGVKGKAVLTALAGPGVRRVDCPKITKAGERKDFLRAELKADGRQVSEDAVSALLDAVGSDLRELCSAASQLLSDTEGPITAEAVARYHRGCAEASGFAIADLAIEGNLAGALEQVRWGQAVGLAPVLVTSSLASTLRSMAAVASAGKGSAYQLAGPLGMPAWKVEKTQRQARAWRPEALSEALRAVAVADGEVKGAGVDPHYAVERVLLAVVAAREGSR